MRKCIAPVLMLNQLMLFGCLGQEKGDSGNVKVTFAEKEAAALTEATEGWVLGSELTTLKMKPMAVAISASLNANKYMVWGAKNCAGKKENTVQDDKEFDYFSHEAGACQANAENEYLDMLDSDALNTTLNSQAWPVPPGTFHYVSVVFCAENKKEGINTISYQAPQMTEAHEVEHCDPFIGHNEAGIVVPEGGSLTIKLTYDLNKLVDSLKHSAEMPANAPGPSDYGCYWTPDGMTQYCPKFGQGSLVPSISE